MYGRIPWAKITEHPDDFLDKKSRPETDHSLQEPSRMMEDAVNIWLKHWYGRQQRSKHPLILKDPARGNAANKDHPKGRGWGKKRIDWVEPDDVNQEAGEDDTDDREQVNGGDTSDGNSEGNPKDSRNGPADDAVSGASGNSPASPATSGKSRASRWAFLATLSADAKFQELLLLMDIARVNCFTACRNRSVLMVM